ncbi:MAG: hypothetical protein ACC645_24995, partial [Pirellulales bacterium]
APARRRRITSDRRHVARRERNVAETDQGREGDLLPELRNHDLVCRDDVCRDDQTRHEVSMPPVWIRVPKLPDKDPGEIARQASPTGNRPRFQPTSTLVGLAGVVVFTAILYWMLPGRGATHTPTADDGGPPIWSQEVRRFQDRAFQPGRPDETERQEASDHLPPPDVGVRYQAAPDSAWPPPIGGESRVIAELEGTIEARPTRR